MGLFSKRKPAPAAVATSTMPYAQPSSIAPAILRPAEREYQREDDREWPTLRLATGWRVDPYGRTDLEQARDMLALLPSGAAFDLVSKMIAEIRDYREVYG